MIYATNFIDFSNDEALFLSVKKGNVTRFYYDGSGNFAGDFSNYEPIEFATVSGESSRREWYTISEISDYIKNGFIAAEDREFYSHHGVNLRRTVAAAVNYLFNSDNGFGASTISQQVIKNISGDNERTAKRKFHEMVRAYYLEQKHSKEEIFEVYLNIIPMGEKTSGVGLASLVYFGKDPNEVSLSEAAALVGITNAPSRYNPYINYDACISKRNVVLGAMLECGYIDDTEYNNAISEELSLLPRGSLDDNINSWFVETVCDELCRDLMERYNYSLTAARSLIANGGLDVYTTMDINIQTVLEEYFRDKSNDELQYSMVVTDSSSTDLRGIIGASGEKSGNRLLNFAQVPRVPGSTLKPLALYAPLINSKRVTWSTIFDDSPIEFSENSDGTVKAFPRNSPNVYEGNITLSKALTYSKNTVAVRLYNMIGADEIYNHLKNDYGFDTVIKSGVNAEGKKITDLSVSPLALGQLSYGIPLRSLTEAYTAFSNDGRLAAQRSYIACTDSSGKTIIRKESNEKQIYSKECAQLMTQMLMRVVNSGTASSIRLKEICDVAGKTGTSGNSRDKLFIGYTPYYSAGIWCGYDTNRSVYGSPQLYAWDDVMREIHKIKLGSSEEIATFSTSKLIYSAYCKDSGKLFSPDCLLDSDGDRLEYGYFIKGTEPQECCDAHRENNSQEKTPDIYNASKFVIPDEDRKKQGLLFKGNGV
ncbi:MAG: transglycosylase domain-containing protein [Clostridia bacterium]|nr:transglycosylase domain-containing protein [Clostridia bacterium]